MVITITKQVKIGRLGSWQRDGYSGIVVRFCEDQESIIVGKVV